MMNNNDVKSLILEDLENTATKGRMYPKGLTPKLRTFIEKHLKEEIVIVNFQDGSTVIKLRGLK